MTTPKVPPTTKTGKVAPAPAQPPPERRVPLREERTTIRKDATVQFQSPSESAPPSPPAPAAPVEKPPQE